MLPGEDGEADQVLRRQCVCVRGRVVSGGVGPHHQVAGVVGGEEVPAIVGIGVVAVERPARPAPARDKRMSRSLVERERRADDGGMIGGKARNDEPAGAPGMSEPVAVRHLGVDAQEGARRHRRAAGSKARLAVTSAAIISPFQSARTLSSRPGRTRRARAASNFSRIGASLASSSMLRGKLEAIWNIMPFEIALRGHVVMRSKKFGIVLAEQRRDLGERPDVELPLLAFRVGVERGAERPSGAGHAARATPRSRVRGCGIGHWPSAGRPARAIRAAARCRRASSRSAARASSRRPSSARSRRRDDRRCRPRRCASE